MMFAVLWDPKVWAAVPFGFWCGMIFIFGAIVGSFLNVCIHRIPLNLSVVFPPSHCPHCRYSIPWYLNLPLITWMHLNGRCRNCQAPISIRYFLVELMTAALFLAAWMAFGGYSPALALVICLVLAGLIVGSLIDLEHLFIPDGLTYGGMAAGLVCSMLIPDLQHFGRGASAWEGGKESLLGLLVGAGEIYGVVRLGKLMLGRYRVPIPPGARVYFTESALLLPDGPIPYEEIFYRRSDTIQIQARRVEMVDRCYWDVPVRLTASRLVVGQDEFDPEKVPCLEVEAAELVLPREAMGLGDVKLMGAIGAFFGWKSVLFALLGSSVVGAVVGVGLILVGRRDWSSRLPFGPYIAFAVGIWIFGGWRLAEFWLR